MLNDVVVISVGLPNGVVDNPRIMASLGDVSRP